MPPVFVTPDPRSHATLRDAVEAVTNAVIAATSLPGPRSPTTPTELANAVASLDLLPDAALYIAAAFLLIFLERQLPTRHGR